MSWVKCKNDQEKLQAIKKYCNEQITKNNREITWLNSQKFCGLDYADEIRELQNRNVQFENIIKIIEADELTSVLIL